MALPEPVVASSPEFACPVAMVPSAGQGRRPLMRVKPINASFISFICLRVSFLCCCSIWLDIVGNKLPRSSATIASTMAISTSVKPRSGLPGGLPAIWLWESMELVIGIGDRKSEEHTSELQSQFHLVCRLLLEKKERI